MTVNYQNLFENPLVTYKLKDTDISHKEFSQLDLYLDLLVEIDPNDKEAMMKLTIETIKNFRKMNTHMYEFEYTCPVCYETSNDSKFLMKLAKCDHKCCLKCWKEQVLLQHTNFKEAIHCYTCSQPIDINLLTKYKLLDDQQMMIQYRRRYDRQYQDRYECIKCQYEFITDKKDSVECPNCYHKMCLKCMLYSHSELNMTCQEFEKFMNTDEYVNFMSKREIERRNKFLDIKYKSDALSLFKKLELELISAVELREKRISEIERQKRLCKENEESLKWISEHTKKCPSCGIDIEKNKGCNHMTCKHCKFEFCWYCFEECKNPCDHFKHCKAGAKWFDDGYRE